MVYRIKATFCPAKQLIKNDIWDTLPARVAHDGCNTVAQVIVHKGSVAAVALLLPALTFYMKFTHDNYQ